MKFEYKTKGTCSSRILFEIEDHKIRDVEFIGGCNGNLQGVSRLIDGMDIDEVVEKLHGIRCGIKETSCPDQLTRAIEAAREKL